MIEAVPTPIVGNPFEVLVAAACVLSGLPHLIRGSAPGSLDRALPHGFVRLWGVELVVGGLLILVGLVTRRMRVERAGLHLLGLAALAYAVALAAATRSSGSVAAGLTAATGLAALARATVLTAAIRVSDVLRRGERRRG